MKINMVVVPGKGIRPDCESGPKRYAGSNLVRHPCQFLICDMRYINKTYVATKILFYL